MLYWWLGAKLRLNWSNIFPPYVLGLFIIIVNLLFCWLLPCNVFINLLYYYYTNAITALYLHDASYWFLKDIYFKTLNYWVTAIRWQMTCQICSSWFWPSLFDPILLTTWPHLSKINYVFGPFVYGKRKQKKKDK